MDTSGIPRVHYKNKRLSFSKPTLGHESTSDNEDPNGWVIVEDYSNTKPSSPKANFTEEEARLLHQIQATNRELERVKALKRREILSTQSRELQLNQNDIQNELLLTNTQPEKRRLAIQRASRASFQRKQVLKMKAPRQSQRTNNRGNRAKGGMKRPIHGKARR